MRIEIGGIAGLSKEYRSFDEIANEFANYQDERGRRVPDYDFGVMAAVIGAFLLEQAAQKLFNEAVEWRRRRAQEELEEERHAELMDKLDDLERAMQQAMETRPPNSALSENAASVSALLQWAKQENIRIVITLETEAESDLKEALETLIKDVPGSAVSEAPSV